MWGVLVCCMPEIFFPPCLGIKYKDVIADVHHQGLNALLVVGLIALFLLMVIAFA